MTMLSSSLLKSASRALIPLLFASALLAQPAAPVRLTLNENPYGPSPAAVRAIQNDLKDLFRSVGDEEAAFVKLVAEHEGVSPDQIVIGDLLEALGLQLSLQGGPGGEFIYSVPGYPAMVDAAAPVGGVAVTVPLDAKHENDLPGIMAKITPRTRAIFLVNPHNPTGTVSDSAAFKTFVRAASKRALVIVDEAYLEFSDDYAGRTVVDLVQAGGNVLIYRTFSKAYGLAALPLGYGIAPAKVAAALKKAGIGAPRSLNRLALVAASATLRDPDYLKRVHAGITTEREKWARFLRELGLKYTPSQANFIFFDAGRPASDVTAALLAQGVVVSRPFPPYDSWVRITIGLPGENERARAAVKAVFAGSAK